MNINYIQYKTRKILEKFYNKHVDIFQDRLIQSYTNKNELITDIEFRSILFNSDGLYNMLDELRNIPVRDKHPLYFEVMTTIGGIVYSCTIKVYAEGLDDEFQALEIVSRPRIVGNISILKLKKEVVVISLENII